MSDKNIEANIIKPTLMIENNSVKRWGHKGCHSSDIIIVVNIFSKIFPKELFSITWEEIQRPLKIKLK